MADAYETRKRDSKPPRRTFSAGRILFLVVLVFLIVYGATFFFGQMQQRNEQATPTPTLKSKTSPTLAPSRVPQVTRTPLVPPNTPIPPEAQTEIALTQFIIQQTRELERQTATARAAPTQTAFAPTRAALQATADALFAPTGTVLAATAAIQKATLAQDADLILTATSLVFSVTQTAYMYELETQVFVTPTASHDRLMPTTAPAYLTATARVAPTQTVFAPTRALLSTRAAAIFAPTGTFLAENASIRRATFSSTEEDDFILTATIFVFSVTQTAYMYELETQVFITQPATSR